jgi:hypothetical protein
MGAIEEGLYVSVCISFVLIVTDWWDQGHLESRAFGAEESVIFRCLLRS